MRHNTIVDYVLVTLFSIMTAGLAGMCVYGVLFRPEDSILYISVLGVLAVLGVLYREIIKSTERYL